MKKHNKHASLDQIEASYGRILQLQKIKGAVENDVTLLRSTQSGTCSSRSTGGCQIGNPGTSL